MGPSEKAKEIIDMFENIDDCDKHYYDRHSPCSHQAKQCAIICVEQIMNEILPPGSRNGEERSKEIYWQEVLDILKAS